MSDVRHTWTLLSNHAHVMLVLGREDNPRVRDIAVRVGITERAVQRILTDLTDGGAITKVRIGRRNEYEVNWQFAMRHLLESTHNVGELLLPLLPIQGGD